jgi:3-oxoacyl-[acyl-carrier protein] reductase
VPCVPPGRYRWSDLLTPEMAGFALVDLVRAGPATTAPEYLLTGAGLQKMR